MAAVASASPTPNPSSIVEGLRLPRWWVPVVVGVLGIVAGVLALVWPEPTLFLVGLFFGAYLVIAGFGDLIAAFAHESSSSAFARVLYGLLGVFTLGAGFILLVRPTASVAVAAFALGLWFLVRGSVQVATGIAIRERRGFNLFLGAIGVAAGVLIVAQPSIGVVTLVYITSFTLIIQGMVGVAIGVGLRAAERAINRSEAAA